VVLGQIRLSSPFPETERLTDMPNEPSGASVVGTGSTGEAVSRRAFVAAAAGGAAVTMVHSSLAAAEETQEIRLGVIGCGGRGSGAINDSLSINEGVRLVATADLYAPKCASLWKAMREAHPNKVAASDTIAAGLDSYRRILDDPNVDLVLITTSPGFRPGYLREAVEAGKHVFTEKPACVDPAGYRICLEAHDAAVARGTAIVAGTQYRRQTNYVAAVEQIREGAIGDVIEIVQGPGPLKIQWFSPAVKKSGVTGKWTPDCLPGGV
jgi:predicted dehydrogenase